MAYQKQTWRDYDDTKTELVNMNNGAVVTPERMNHIETGIANSADKQEVTAQLAQTNRVKIGGGVKAEPEDMSSDLLGLITGEGGPINLETIPQDYSVTPKKTTFMVESRNQFNPETAVKGFELDIHKHDGSLRANSLRTTSDFIPVKGNTNYIPSGHNEDLTIDYHAYNADKNPIGSVVSISQEQGRTTTNLTRYIRVSIYTSEINTFQIEEGNISSEYMGYGEIKIPRLRNTLEEYMITENEEWI